MWLRCLWDKVAAGSGNKAAGHRVDGNALVVEYRQEPAICGHRLEFGHPLGVQITLELPDVDQADMQVI